MSRSAAEQAGMSASGPSQIGPAAAGALIGGGALGLLLLSLTLSGRSDWLARALASWYINLFTFAAAGSALMLLGSRLRWIRSQEEAFRLPLLDGDDDTLVLPEDALECRRRMREIPEPQRHLLVLELLGAALQRARANWSAEDASAAVHSQAELTQGRMDADYAAVRYLAWAIPPIGFIGTVLGIGRAMGALQHQPGDTGLSREDMAAAALQLAFDTTFVALVLSLVVMFVLFQVQARDDALVVRASDWCLRRFVYRMHIPKESR